MMRGMSNRGLNSSTIRRLEPVKSVLHSSTCNVYNGSEVVSFVLIMNLFNKLMMKIDEHFKPTVSVCTTNRLLHLHLQL